jgi:hypothetical protein
MRSFGQREWPLVKTLVFFHTNTKGLRDANLIWPSSLSKTGADKPESGGTRIPVEYRQAAGATLPELFGPNVLRQA